MAQSEYSVRLSGAAAAALGVIIVYVVQS